MELEIVSKKDNPLLDRVELEVLAHHAGQPTPKRGEIRDQVAAAMKAKKDQVLVDHMESTFGKGETRGYVKVYKTKEAAQAIEREPILKRNTPGTSTKKAKEPAKEPTEGPAKEPAKEPAKGPAKGPAKEPVKEPAEAPATEPAEEPAKEDAKKGDK